MSRIVARFTASFDGIFTAFATSTPPIVQKSFSAVALLEEGARLRSLRATFRGSTPGGGSSAQLADSSTPLLSDLRKLASVPIVHLVVTRVAYTDQVPRVDSEVRPFLNRVDVMHRRRRRGPPVPPALSAHVAVAPEDRLTLSLPLCRLVERMRHRTTPGARRDPRRSRITHPRKGRGREVRHPRPCGVGGGRDFVA